ncbi:hypothetical protein CTEN210_06604 [Chaetoceros tenuissimus]|uniref:Glycosyl transferase family 1 domain-containing protein n=1 Tax=Chaetoceros tenuissimus TaxID=426638 RepID=A0AAD3CQP3_9STRA|nr:hypothetical protein CTEN210_06604 [Chaetoceros tenuissimus]
MATSPPKRILFLSLELNFAPFSGNGVLARSLVSSLSKRNDCTVKVICAKPHSTSYTKYSLSADINMMEAHDSLEIWPINLPPQCSWKRLDRSCAHQEYATLCQQSDILQKIQKFDPNHIIAVDWHGMLAYKAIASKCELECKIIYYNFRVYSSSSWDHPASNHGEKNEQSDDEFYKEQEQMCCRIADAIICLANHDLQMLQRLIREDKSIVDQSNKMKKIKILFPPLRGDILALAEKYETSSEPFDSYLPIQARVAMEKLSDEGHSLPKRCFITCCTRLSPEKAPHHFITLLQNLGGEDFLKKNSWVPVLCGAKSVSDYAETIIKDFRSICKEWPCVVIDHHLGAQELAALFLKTAVNVHPCLYDAYGMTLVESAAFQCPSIINSGNKVGATSLLVEGHGCIAVGLEEIIENDKCSLQMKILLDVLASPESLNHVGKEAKSKALGWDETSCCQGLVNVLDNI